MAKKKTTPRKAKAPESKAGAGAAIAERSKDSKKQAFGKAKPKRVDPAAGPVATMPAKSELAGGPSIASRVIRGVKKTASGAVAMAAAIIGKDGAKSKVRSK